MAENKLADMSTEFAIQIYEFLNQPSHLVFVEKFIDLCYTVFIKL